MAQTGFNSSLLAFVSGWRLVGSWLIVGSEANKHSAAIAKRKGQPGDKSEMDFMANTFDNKPQETDQADRFEDDELSYCEATVDRLFDMMLA